MYVSPEVFLSDCGAQGVTLVDNLYNEIANYHNGEGLLSGIREAGYILRNEPRTRLADKPIEGRETESTASRILRSIINQSLDPMPEETSDFTFDVSRNPKRLGVCHDADGYFAQTVVGLTAKQSSYKDKTGYEIYEKDGKPLLLRKSVGKPSSLALEEVVIDGIAYPAGSLLRAYTRPEIEKHYAYVDEDEALILPVDRIEMAGFVRPSAFTFDRGEVERRYIATMACNALSIGLFSDERKLLQKATMADVIDIVGKEHASQLLSV